MKMKKTAFIYVLVLNLLSAAVYAETGEAVEPDDTFVNIKAEYYMPAQGVKIKAGILKFSCMKLKEERNVIKFCPLQLDSDAAGVEGISVSRHQSDLLVVFSMYGGEEGDSVWSKLCRFSGATGDLLWSADIPGFNIGEMLKSGDIAYITAIGTTAKIDLATGKYIWQHKDLYKKGAYNDFRKPVLENGNVLFVDGNDNRIVIDDHSGSIIDMPEPVAKKRYGAEVWLGVMAVQGYVFYEMFSDKNEGLAWAVLGMNLVGWTDQSVIDVPFVSEEISSALMYTGSITGMLYPLIMLPHALGAGDEARAWRAGGGIAAMVLVPAAAGIIRGFASNGEKNAAVDTIFTPAYAGISISREF